SGEELNVMRGNESVCYGVWLGLPLYEETIRLTANQSLLTCHLSPFWFHMQFGVPSYSTRWLTCITGTPSNPGKTGDGGCSWRPGFKFPGQSFQKSTKTVTPRRTRDEDEVFHMQSLQSLEKRSSNSPYGS
ncbi:hypothetical protein K439DRAFT_1642082, partial [Ramaria rubella]